MRASRIASLIAVGAISLPLLAVTTATVAASPRAVGSSWEQVAPLLGSDSVANDEFGNSVAISGTTAVVGAWFHAGYAGRAYVFENSGGAWRQVAPLLGSDTVAGDWFGSSVAVSGTTIVVGAWLADETGRAYVFEKSGAGWKEAAELKASDSSGFDDYFGDSVAISGRTIVVGSSGHANFAGRAYVFESSGGIWKETAELKGSDTGGKDGFGDSVAISGTTIVVGADDHANGAGRAYVFENSGGAWKETAELKGSDTVTNDPLGDSFGDSVAISGTTIVVGAELKDYGAGRAYVFENSGSAWRQTAELTGSYTAGLGSFGDSVAISGTTAIVGACVASPAGAAYVFTRTGSVWRQVAELENSDMVISDLFGDSVAISGRTAIVGAPGKPKQPIYPGRAYVFAS